jgi:tripartite-type tricarboxylate transporter receptor subunit TctC
MMSKILGQSVLVENRSGGGGSIGTNYVVQSKPNGYNLLYAAGTVLTLTPHVSDLPYKFDDLLPIAMTSYIPQFLAVGVNTPWKTIQDFVEYAKKHPHVIKYGSTGTGSAVHFCGEALAAAAGIELTHVPFKGVAEAITAVIGGHIDGVFAMPQPIIPQVRGGKLRVLAVCSSQRYPDLPDVPTLPEAGIPFETRAGINWFGFFAPKGTPKPICDKLTETVDKVITDQESFNTLRKIGSLPEFRGQKEFKTLLEKQSLMFKELSDKLGVKKK